MNRKNVQKKKHMMVFYANSRSARNKINELRLVACAGNFDIIALTETWYDLKSRDMTAECNIQGFKLFNVDRCNGKGGGVALYVRENINCCIKKGIKIDGAVTESVWVEFVEGQEKLILGVIYRPPGLDHDRGRLLWDEIVRASGHSNVVIVGDFNFSQIDWNSLTGNLESSDFMETVQDCFLKQSVTEPTRGNNLLDLVLSNKETLVNNLEITEELGASDHKSITFSINWECKNNDNTVKIPDFRSADYNGLREHLSNLDWGYLANDFIDDNHTYEYEGICFYDCFLNNVHSAQSIYIPQREIRSNNNDPKWVNRRLKHLLGEKRGIYRRIRRGEVNLTDQYVQLKREVKRRLERLNVTMKLELLMNQRLIQRGSFKCIGRR
ncbi:uncharacterized protein [Cherax quadricarinatus]|uniref:uncharacterized protein n=1 Tax=Cherax quadricarinatus TaxID=27406 RepID=UPI00387EC899